MKQFPKISGILAIIIALSIVVWCWQLSPPDTAISDFGMQPPTDTVFNMGIVVSGFLIGIWAIFMIRAHQIKLSRSLQILFVYSSFALAGVGFFPVVFDSWRRPVHWIFALSFFIGYMVLILILQFQAARYRKQYSQLALAIIAWLVAISLMFYSKLWMEIWVIGVILLWILLNSIRSLRNLR